MRTLVAAAADVAAIAIFAAVGRASHAELNGVVGIVDTAWPFLAGGLAGALLMRLWRPTALSSDVSTGLGIWAGAVAGGMLLRAVTGAGVQLSFVMVTATVLAILLLGWRAGYALLNRRRRVRVAA